MRATRPCCCQFQNCRCVQARSLQYEDPDHRDGRLLLTGLCWQGQTQPFPLRSGRPNFVKLCLGSRIGTLLNLSLGLEPSYSRKIFTSKAQVDRDLQMSTSCYHGKGRKQLPPMLATKFWMFSSLCLCRGRHDLANLVCCTETASQACTMSAKGIYTKLPPFDCSQYSHLGGLPG